MLVLQQGLPPSPRNRSFTSQHRSLCGSSGTREGNPHQFIRFSPGSQAGAHFRCCGDWFLVWSSVCRELLISTNGITHVSLSGLSGNHLLAGFLAWEEVLRALLVLLGEWGRHWVKERRSCWLDVRADHLHPRLKATRKKDPRGLPKSVPGPAIPSSARTPPG